MNRIESIFSQVLNCAFSVHSNLGPGLLENTYQTCLYHEIRKRNLFVQKEKAMPLVYDGIHMETGYRVDLMVENQVIIEIKAVDALNDIHLAQILTYMKLSECRLGLLVNFNVTHLKNGIKRVIQTSRPSCEP